MKNNVVPDPPANSKSNSAFEECKNLGGMDTSKITGGYESNLGQLPARGVEWSKDGKVIDAPDWV